MPTFRTEERLRSGPDESGGVQQPAPPESSPTTDRTDAQASLRPRRLQNVCILEAEDEVASDLPGTVLHYPPLPQDQVSKPLDVVGVVALVVRR